MDFSEKDAARSKWKLTQRHRRGRGAGRGAPSRGGRGGRGGGGATAAQDLGSNADRYHDAEAEAAAEAAALGPVQRSEGADLAQLLAQAEPFDRGYYYRARVNLAQDVGLLPESSEGTFQGLSFDLRGLATCLELVPKNRLLDTDAFSDDEDGDSWWDSEEDELSDLPPDAEEGWGEGGQPAVELAGGAADMAVAAAGAQLAAAAAPDAMGDTQVVQGGQPAAAGSSPAAAAGTGAAAARGGTPAAGGMAPADIDDLLSELLGEQATIGGAAATTQQQSRAAQCEAPAAYALAAGQQQRHMPAAPAVAPGGLVGQVRAVAHRHQQPSAEPLGQRHDPPQGAAAAAAAAEEEHDDELDMLLGIAAGKPAAAAPSGSSSVAPSVPRSQSLEDWLDGL